MKGIINTSNIICRSKSWGFLSSTTSKRHNSGPLYKKNITEQPHAATESIKSTSREPVITAPGDNVPSGGKAVNKSSSNPYRNYYSSYSFPFVKVVLGAIFTYQIIYWSWLKLEGLEKENDGKTKIEGLKDQLISAAKERRPKE